MGPLAIIAFIVYGVVFFVLQSVVATMRRVQATPRKEAPGRFILHTVSMVLFVPSANYATKQQVHVWLVVLGCCLALAGLCVSMWAQWALGRNWVGGIGLHKKHKLVTEGPYRYVRHPLYSGIVLAAFGLGVCSLNPWFAGAMLCFAGGFVIRCLAEDILLKKRFPRQYLAYAATTGALIPKARRRKS